MAVWNSDQRFRGIIPALLPFLLAALLVVGVQSPGLAQTEEEPEITPEREQELFAQVDKMLATLSEIMGLEAREPVVRAVMSREEIRELVERRLHEETDPEEIRLEELFLKKFGLVDESFDLAEQTVDVLTEQATALYDFKTKKLYLASWTDPDMQEFALVHELVHALQDQHFNLQKWVEGGEGADADLARTAVVEGQASWVMTEYVFRQTGRSLADNRLLAVAAVSASRVEARKYPVFSASPLFLRESLLFPYTEGLLFQQALVEEKDQEAFSQVFVRPPVSSQHIFDPGSYLQDRKPTRPKLPKANLGGAFREVSKGEIGQLDHLVLLRQYLGEDAANQLAPAWRGGRFVLFENESKDRVALTYAVEWETPEDAARYFDYYKQICESKDASLKLSSPEESRHHGKGSDGAVIIERKGTVVTSIEGMPEDRVEWN